jgi:peptidoglycan/xylan/chitin deacetylase (PgdA/CDA1 family)
MSADWQPRRDFVGYGANPPDPKWPNGARLAVNFVMNYEEGSEASVPDGEDYTDTNLTEAHGVNQPAKGRDLAAESMFEYGSRVAFWRLMRLFQERKLAMTVFGCALALERNPQAAQAIRASGFDVCCHGWRWLRPTALTPAQESEQIAKAVASLQNTVGERPLGWYCRYGPSVHTRRLLVEEGGFLYDSDSYADELPYWQTVAGQPHLVVPYSLATNDAKYVATTGNAAQWFEFIRDAFDMLYKEGATHPKMMSIGMHMRLVGHPSRAAGLERVLDHVMAHNDVWIARRIEIARHWQHIYPYSGKGLNEQETSMRP